jgi:RES domain-containing protein
VVHTSGSLALAALEVFVNLDPEDMPQDLVSIAATIPDELPTERVAIAHLPRGWERAPAPEYLQRLGAGWVRRQHTAVLSVPSAVILTEHNFLLNPAHWDFKRIRIGKPAAFHFDPRLWK